MKIYSQNEIEKLVEILNNNGVICVPTDTVYGICAKFNSVTAYNKMMEIKKRPKEKKFPVMCSDKEQIKSIAEIDENIEKIIDSFMPGPITLVLNKKQNVNSNDDTIAIRMATSEFLKELIIKLGCPLFMSSANISGMPVCENFEDIKSSLPSLDGFVEGTPKFGISSTIVDCTTKEIKLLRKGPISINDIKNL